jgi:hypothetical protein
MESVGEGSLAEDSIGTFSPWFRLARECVFYWHFCSGHCAVMQSRVWHANFWPGTHVRKIPWQRQHWHFVLNRVPDRDFLPYSSVVWLCVFVAVVI